MNREYGSQWSGNIDRNKHGGDRSFNRFGSNRFEDNNSRPHVQNRGNQGNWDSSNASSKRDHGSFFNDQHTNNKFGVNKPKHKFQHENLNHFGDASTNKRYNKKSSFHPQRNENDLSQHSNYQHNQPHSNNHFKNARQPNFNQNQYQPNPNKFNQNQYQHNPNKFNQNQYQHNPNQFNQNQYQHNPNQFNQNQYQPNSNQFNQNQYQPNSNQFNQNKYNNPSNKIPRKLRNSGSGWNQLNSRPKEDNHDQNPSTPSFNLNEATYKNSRPGSYYQNVYFQALRQWKKTHFIMGVIVTKSIDIKVFYQFFSGNLTADFRIDFQDISIVNGDCCIATSNIQSVYTILKLDNMELAELGRIAIFVISVPYDQKIFHHHFSNLGIVSSQDTLNLSRIFEKKLSLSYPGNLNALVSGIGRICLNLKYLDLSQNGVSSLESFCCLKELPLERLDLVGNCLDTIESIKTLASLTELKHLNLQSNPVTTIEQYRLKIFMILPSLEFLDSEAMQNMTFTCISDMAPSVTSSWNIPNAFPAFVSNPAHKDPLIEFMTLYFKSIDENRKYLTDIYSSNCVFTIRIFPEALINFTSALDTVSFLTQKCPEMQHDLNSLVYDFVWISEKQAMLLVKGLVLMRNDNQGTELWQHTHRMILEVGGRQHLTILNDIFYVKKFDNDKSMELDVVGP